MKTYKELKNACRQIHPVKGVFRITNIQNGRMFIDNSLDMNARWNRHKTELRLGTHRNKQLQEDWKRNGGESFSFEVLSEL